MRAYRSLQVLLASIFAAYLVLAAVEVASGEKGFAFPVCSWALFEKVPNRTAHYVARVRSLDGPEVEPARDPLGMEEAIPEAGSMEVRATVASLGAAIAAGDEGRIAAERRALERVHLRGRRMRYEIEEHLYDDPRDGWRGRAPASVRTLGVFETTGPGR